MTRVLVCGGRHYSNRNRVAQVLFAAVERLGMTTIIQGAADGADRLAAEWGWDNRVGVASFPAKWNEDGKAAGPIRNARMLREGKPDFVIAFPGGKGTADMVQQAEAAGVPVYRIDWK